METHIAKKVNYRILNNIDCCKTCKAHDVIDECLPSLFCLEHQEEVEQLGICNDYIREKQQS